MMLVVKNPAANTGNVRDLGLTPGLGRFPGGGHGRPLKFSCLENPMDRGAWQATVHRVAQRWTQLKGLSMHNASLLFLLISTSSVYIREMDFFVCESQILISGLPFSF